MFTVAHKKFSMRKLFLLGCVALALFPAVSRATNTTDVSVGLKILFLMQEHYSGVIPVAIVYNANDPGSLDDANNIKKNLDKGVGVPEELAISAYLVSSAQIDKLHGAKLAFLADHISSDGVDSVCDKAGQQGILTISSNISCVRANKCVLGIITKPRVEVYYSAVAAKASHVNFSSAFIMLAKPI
jgi:hypothetical protein